METMKEMSNAKSIRILPLIELSVRTVVNHRLCRFVKYIIIKYAKYIIKISKTTKDTCCRKTKLKSVVFFDY